MTNEHYFNILFERMAQGVIFQNADGTIALINPAAKEILGASEPQLHDVKTIDDNLKFIHEDGSPYPTKDHPTMITLRTGQPVKDEVMGIYVPASQTYRWILINTVPLFKPGASKPYQTFVTFDDITKEHNALTTIAENQQFLDSLNNSLKDVVFTVNMPDRIIQYVNSSINAIFGYEANECIGKTTQFLYENEEEYQSFGKELEEALRRKADSVEKVCSFKKKTGEIFSGDVSTTFLYSNGVLDYVVSLVRDITEFRQKEALLKNSEERFRTLSNLLPVGIYLTTPEGKCLYTNPTWLKMAGLTIEQALGDGWIQGLHPEDREIVFTNWQKMTASNGQWGCEYRFQTPDGKVTWVYGLATPLKDTDGKITGYIGANTDITDRKLAEQILVDNESKYHSLFSGMTEGVALHEIIYSAESKPINYRIIDVNPAFEKHTGLTISEVQGRLATEAYKTDAPPYFKEYETVARTGKPYSFETYFQQLDKYFSIYVHSPKPGLFITVFSDITESKKVSERIDRILKELEFAQQIAHIGNWTYDPVSQQPTWSNEMFQIWGINPKLGAPKYQDHKKLIHPDDWERFDTAVKAAVEFGEPYEIELRIIRPNGELRTIVTICKPQLDSNGKIISLSGTNQDITERKLAEEILRENEQKYRFLHEAAGVGVGYYSPDGKIISYNRLAASHMNGVPEDFNGKSIWDVFPKAEADFYFERIKLAIKSEKPQEYDDKVDLPIGHKWFHSVFTKVLDSKGKVLGIQIISSDITERKLTETALKESQKQYRTLIDNANEAIIVAQRGKIVFTNHVTQQILTGYSEQELKEKPFLDFIHPDDRAMVGENYQRRLKGENIPSKYEFRVTTKDGRVKWVEINAVLIEWQGEPATLNFLTDVTERRIAEHELRESERRFRSLYEESPLAYQSLGADGCFLEVNPTWLHVMGYTREEVIGKWFGDFLIPSQVELFKERFPLFKKKGKTTTEFEIRRKDGSYTTMQFNGRVGYTSDGLFKQTHCVLADITEIRKSEKETLANEKRLEILIKILEYKPETVQAFLDYALEQAILLTQSKYGYIYFYDDSKKEFTLNTWSKDVMDQCAVQSPQSIYQLEKTGIWGEVARQNRPIMVNDFQSPNPLKKGYPKGHVELNKYLSVPVHEGGKIVAVVGVANKDVDYTNTDLYQLTLLMESVWKSTESIRKGSALLHAAEEWRTTFDSIEDMVAIVDSKHKILRVNQAFAKTLGKEPHEIVGKPCYELIHGMNQPHPMCPHALTLTTKKVESSEYFDKKLKVWVEATSSPIFNEDGQLTGSVHIIKDISERKQAEETLKALSIHQETILSAVPDIIMEVDNNKVYTWANQAGIDFFGEDVIGREAAYYFEGEQNTYQQVQPVFDGTQQSIYIESWQRRKDGTKRLLAWWCRSLLDSNGKVKGGLSAATDITELRLTEIEKQQLRDKAEMSSRLAAVGEMAAGIAHEINNPLTGVIGFSELLSDRKDLPPDVLENLKIINDGSQRVKDIVKRMLTFARQSKPEKRPVDIAELLENTLELRSYVLKTSNIVVVREYAPDLPLISVDSGQIQQVFLNLIVNAEHAMKKAHGKGVLTITTKKLDNRIRISITDDGPGLSDELKAKMFQPFFTTKDPGEGTGLGLSLAFGIIREHGGTIRADSTEGQGTSIVIELPITPPVENQAAVAVESIPLTVPTEKARILIVDDEPTVRAFEKAALTRAGHEVDDTGNPEDVLPKLKQTSYDVIFCDVRMPGMSGIELYRSVVKNHPEMKGKIVFVTGDASSRDIKDFLLENKLSYLSKPIDIETMLSKVNEILNSKQQ
ncbi:MAG: PAS domain S-box protein [Dehalogenimonas sp.]